MLQTRIITAERVSRLDSCIANDQRLLLADGSKPTANEILMRVASGERVDFLTDSVNGWIYNPVVRAIRTRGRGIRINFEDGRTLSLTTGHVVPVAKPSLVTLRDIDESPLDVDFSVYEEPVTLAGQVSPGAVLLDGVVSSVELLGRIDAVRLWTAIPAWILTDEHLSIGTRWHEISVGLAYVQETSYDEGLSSVVLWPGRNIISSGGEWESRAQSWTSLASASWLSFRLRQNSTDFWQGLGVRNRQRQLMVNTYQAIPHFAYSAATA